MSELDSRLHGPVEQLRRLPRVDERALQRLRSELRAAGGAPHPAASRWLMLSPARAALAAALLVLATSGVWAVAWLAARAEPESTGAGTTPVQFVFVAATARSVSLVGDFNDWDIQATPMVRTPSGVWSVVVPLEAGRFSYSFVVDDRWHADPQATVSTNDFGRPSSSLLVSATESAP